MDVRLLPTSFPPSAAAQLVVLLVFLGLKVFDGKLTTEIVGCIVLNRKCYSQTGRQDVTRRHQAQKMILINQEEMNLQYRSDQPRHNCELNLSVAHVCYLAARHSNCSRATMSSMLPCND